VGDIEAIARSAGELCARPAVSGLDLLAYRADGDAPALIQAICRAAAGKPVIVAGSIDCEARIAAVARGRAAAFTVGTAALDAVFPASPELARQLEHIRMVAERI
jgi:hypothetical protein